MVRHSPSRFLTLMMSTLCLAACGTQRDAPLTATATSYRLCELDLHCPGGMYCSAGVCDHDCSQDSDCGPGEGCDLRGRCGASGALAGPPKYGGHLVTPPSSLQISPEAPSAVLTLENDGVEDIGRFHVISDDPNVTASPSSGALPSGGSVPVTVQVARGFTGTGATIHILTTGGRADVLLVYGSTLTGRLVGTVDVQAPYQLGSAPFALEIGGNPTALTGAVDGTASLLWPVNAPVAATDDGTNFTASFTFVQSIGTPGNPWPDLPVQRTIELVGTHSGALAVSGTYTETIAGLPGGNATTSGAFSLQGGGAPTGLSPVQQPHFVAGRPVSNPNACACTAATCPGTTGGDADWFFEQGFAFETWSQNQSYQGSNSCVLSSGLVGACTVAPDIACALGDYLANGATDGVVDVWRAQATYALLAGKTGLANMLQPVPPATGSPLTLQEQVTQLELAIDDLATGLHASPSGLLSSNNLGLARTPSTLPLLNAASTRDNGGFAGEEPQRFGGVVATTLFAASEQVDRQQRDGEPAGSILSAAQRAASGALLDLAAIGAVLGPQTEPISGLAASFSPLVATFQKVSKGLNAAGYPATYVPFIYNPAVQYTDLYHQVAAVGTTFQAAAVSDEAALGAQNLNVNASVAAVNAAIGAAAATAASEVTTLCGPLPNPLPSIDGCGLDGGQIAVDQAEMNAAAVALSAARDQHSAAVLKLTTLNQQAQQELHDQVDQLVQVISDNNEIMLIDTAKAEEQEVNQAYQCVSGILFPGGASFSGLGAMASVGLSSSGMPFGSCVPFVESLATSPVSQTAQEDEARADQQITLMLGSQQVTDNSMVIAVQDAQAAETAAVANVVQQTQLFDAATQKLNTDYAQLQQALANATQSNLLASQNPATNPAFRLLQNAALLQWTADMRLAREWCFLTARALTYTLDASTTEEGDCLAASTAEDTQAALEELTSDLAGDAMAYSWNQERTDLISMQVVMGIVGSRTDPVTGQTLTPAQQFQAMLALPTHRDSAGNPQLQFATSIATGNPIFSTDVGTDLIYSVVGNLIGSQMSGPTGYLTLTQSGNGQLRSYVDESLTTYKLDPKTALVPAGINMSSPTDSGNTPVTPNTDLYGRPVADSGWTLALDQVDDPRNALLTLSDIEDIQLFIDHRARTIQGAP